MNNLIIGGSHFGGVLRCIAWLQDSNYTKGVEIVCDDEEEVYVLQTTDTTEVEVLTVVGY